MNFRRLSATAVGASTGLAIAATVVALPNPVRAVLVFWFLLTCPGLAVVPLLGIRQRATELALAVAVSLALDTLVAEAMVLSRLWSPPAGLAILAAFSLAGASL